MTRFDDLALIKPLRDAIRDVGYETPTPIQVQAIPPLLDGEDMLGCAQTGTGKTAAFALPVLQHIADTHMVRGRREIRALVLAPTRELAAQIGESFGTYGKYLRIRHTVIFGGVSQNRQVQALRQGVEIVVATPGRLLDLMGQGHVSLKGVDFLILDEADRMLDMGFIHDLKKILRVLPADRQNLLFSATMPKAIVGLAQDFLHNPVRVEVTPESTTVERIVQSVMFVEKSNKKHLLPKLIRDLDVEQALVFTRTKHGANRLVRHLEGVGIASAAIHGNKSQNARQRALDGFRRGAIPILVATDIASRGIDVDGVSHVFNFDLPNEPESYVHRIGRTARAGRDGVAISFCDHSEGAYLRAVEKITGQPIPVTTDHDFHCEGAVPGRNPAPPPRRGGGGGGGGRGRRPASSTRGRRPAGAGGGGGRRPSGGGRRPSGSGNRR